MSAPATTLPAFKLSLYPASVRLIGKTGQSYHGVVKVTDSGTAPLKISVGSEQLTHCATGPAPTWLKVTGASKFVLQPGHSRTVAYSVHSAPGTTGSGAVVANGSPVHAGHGGQLSASIGSRVTLGKIQASCHTTVAAAPHASAASSHLGLYVLLALVALLAGLAIVIVRRRQRGRHAI